MSIKDRILKYIEYKGLSKYKFYKETGIANGFLDKEGDITVLKSADILAAYPDLNPDWLLFDKGGMLKEANPKNEAVFIDNPNIIMIPLVSQYAYAGYLSGFSDMDYIEALPKIPIIADHDLRGDYMGFEVRGDSMDDGTADSIREGDVLACRIVRPDLWKYKLHIDRWDFVIVHKTDGMLIKRITEHNPETGEIKIHSLNQFYKDKVLNLADVAQLFNVVQVLRSRKR